MKTALLLIASTVLGAHDLHTVCPVGWTLPLHIATQEGWNVLDSPVRKWNNPGALVYAHQRDATRGPRGFARFSTPGAGWLALNRDLRAKLREGRSLHQAWEYLTDVPKGLYF